MQGRMKRKNCRPTTKKSRLQLGCVILAEWREIDTSKDSLISIVNLQSCYFVLPWFYLINNRHGCWMLQQTIWLWNQSLLQWICGKCLAWYPGRDDFLPLRLWRLIKAKNIISRCTLWHFNSMFGSSLSASSAYQRFTNKWNQLCFSASIQPPYLEC